MAEITIVKPHDEGKSNIEVTVNGEKWSLIRGETADVPEYIAEEVRRSLAQRESLSLSDIDEREDTGEGGGGGGNNVETATIVITASEETYTITSGAFPDWFAPENLGSIYGDVAVDCIYGKGVSANYTAKICACPLSELSWAIVGINYDAEKDNPDVPFITGNYEFEITSIIEGLTDIEYTNGTVTIKLMYIPEE